MCSVTVHVVRWSTDWMARQSNATGVIFEKNPLLGQSDRRAPFQNDVVVGLTGDKRLNDAAIECPSDVEGAGGLENRSIGSKAFPIDRPVADELPKQRILGLEPRRGSGRQQTSEKIHRRGGCALSADDLGWSSASTARRRRRLRVPHNTEAHSNAYLHSTVSSTSILVGSCYILRPWMRS